MGVIMKDWKVLVLDLDGTLLCCEGEVSPQNIHALDCVRESGVEIVIATGRCFAECKHILDEIQHEGACITAGGSQLTESNGKGIARDVVNQEIAKEVTDYILQGGHRCLLLKDSTACETDYVLVGDAPLHHASHWWFDTLNISVHEIREVGEDPWPEDTLRVGAVAEERGLLPIAKELEPKLQGRARLQHWSAVTATHATESSTHLLEVFAHSVSKWTMLERYLGNQLDSTKVVAIGDGLNDIELFKGAGLSIVMENANEHVQGFADVVTGHHNKHGFADAMHRWIIPT